MPSATRRGGAGSARTDDGAEVLVESELSPRTAAPPSSRLQRLHPRGGPLSRRPAERGDSTAEVPGRQFRSFASKRRKFGPGTTRMRAALDVVEEVRAKTRLHL